ncbi:MAG: undecaprenyl-diphosphate phosphatase [Candidatus Kapabacteria bacterium]|nr:undecaprenyl-diphosphate phosphatase [Candidatus Kapabacteria bacterium]MCS7169655.1 undecaprenyl-diphosphate phosphatase [Candidatus Kapabacteria bacterium]MDW8225664.1 undecaprenyl-diphosphate phosphatase [Bacteroidota bacterium]
MGLWEAVAIGIVQGVTEFLPISSTAHVTLMGMLVGANPQAVPQQWTAFLATIQLGSLAAVLWYFRSDVLSMTKGAVTGGVDEDGRRLLVCVVAGSIPIGALGLALRPLVESSLTKDPLLIAGALVGVSGLMALAEWANRGQRTLAQIRWRDALLIGAAQVLALMPGSSRSGTTIAAAMLLGIARRDAAHFSFLLSIPAIAASGLLELNTLLLKLSALGSWHTFTASFGAAFLSSYAAISFLLRYLRTHTLWVFIVYRLALAGALALGYGLSHQ